MVTSSKECKELIVREQLMVPLNLVAMSCLGDLSTLGVGSSSQH